MVNSTRGMGIENRIPWPSLTKDYQHYMSLSTKPTKEGKKNVVIKGRRTWESTKLPEATAPDVINIVVSTTLKEPPEHVHHVAMNLTDALEIASRPPLSDVVDRIWVLGGVPIYKVAFESPLCHRVYLTRIYGEFECDHYLPEFEDKGFNKISDNTIEQGIIDENGIQYEFEVYERQQKCYTKNS